MKLPRWLVIAMLTTSMLSVLAAAGWWWVTWPERTMREFVYLSQAGKWVELNQLYGGGTHIQTDLDDEATEYWVSFFKSLRLEPRGSASLSDILIGRRRFRLFYEPTSVLPEDEFFDNPMELTVERGRVLP